MQKPRSGAHSDPRPGRIVIRIREVVCAGFPSISKPNTGNGDLSASTWTFQKGMKFVLTCKRRSTCHRNHQNSNLFVFWRKKEQDKLKCLTYRFPRYTEIKKNIQMKSFSDYAIFPSLKRQQRSSPLGEV